MGPVGTGDWGLGLGLDNKSSTACKEEMSFFVRGVGNFDLFFLSHFFPKRRYSCAYLKGNFLNFPKLTLILSLVHLQRVLWAFKCKSPFFLDALYNMTILAMFSYLDSAKAMVDWRLQSMTARKPDSSDSELLEV